MPAGNRRLKQSPNHTGVLAVSFSFITVSAIQNHQRTVSTDWLSSIVVAALLTKIQLYLLPSRICVFYYVCLPLEGLQVIAPSAIGCWLRTCLIYICQFYLEKKSFVLFILQPTFTAVSLLSPKNKTPLLFLSRGAPMQTLNTAEWKMGVTDVLLIEEEEHHSKAPIGIDKT